MSVASSPLSASLPSGPLLLVEDDPSMQLRLGDILATLGFRADAVHVAGTLAQAYALMSAQSFAMALVDLGLPDGSGLDLIRALRARDAALPILVISAWSTQEVIVSALQMGASGYVLKERDDVEVALSIRSALRGGAPIDPFVARHILSRMLPPAPASTETPPAASDTAPQRALSPREIEILHLVAKGLTNREIAEVTAISTLTVAAHVRNIYSKLAVNTRTQAVFEARTSGLLP